MCVPIDRRESRLAEAADRPRQALTAHGVDDQFARLSGAPPVIEEMTQSTPPVRPLRRSQVRPKGSRLEHAPAHPCIQYTV